MVSFDIFRSIYNTNRRLSKACACNADLKAKLKLTSVLFLIGILFMLVI